ncbi:MAG: hypothetical protein A3J49_16155 [Gallionellales bacterium RIFCSPHIGHO2_02_FULL_57_16]|nr:MAG: hypothetical protein A3J49_16155 [Gallionellales bacterium RIFCSPHIGHO2_02_FULL_57_16]
MKFSKSDFPVLRWGILAFCASALVSAATLYISNEYAKKAQSDLHNARNMGNDARRRLAAAQEDRENMSIYADEYGALIKRKIIGDDQRLDWMEGLEKLRQMNLVTDFGYNIAPQKKYAPQPPFDSGNFDIHYSETKLRFDLLHEEQLVDFFTALRKKIDGWYQLEGCTLQRSASNEEGAKAGASQLRAECSGGWITLKNRNAQP